MIERDHAAGYWLSLAADEAVSEAKRARTIHAPYSSWHEAYAALLEEVDELWAEIKAGQRPRELAAEAIQVAAVALRIAVAAKRRRKE